MYNRLTDLLKNAYLGCLRNDYGFTGTDEDLECYMHFYISGSLAVIGKWADSNFDYSDEKIMMMFTDINNNLDIHFP